MPVPGRLDEPFAQMQQVAARLYLACTAQVRWRDRGLPERLRAGDDDMVGNDRAELERKDVEGPIELAVRNNQWSRQPGGVPRGQPRGTAAQILLGQ